MKDYDYSSKVGRSKASRDDDEEEEDEEEDDDDEDDDEDDSADNSEFDDDEGVNDFPYYRLKLDIRIFSLLLILRLE
jgi:hypothetical protein